MPGKIHQNIDLIRVNLPGSLLRRKLRHIPPADRKALQPLRHAVALPPLIDKDLEFLFIVVTQKGQQKIHHRMQPEIRRNIPDTQMTLRLCRLMREGHLRPEKGIVALVQCEGTINRHHAVICEKETLAVEIRL